MYKKGPQTLAETIKEVGKLQAAQQTTSTLLPTSSVNTMSSDDNKCFPCQETSHMAHYCPHIRCFDCDKYGMLPWTVLIKYHLQAHQHTIQVIPLVGMTDPHQGIIATTGILTMIIETRTGPVTPDLTHTILDTGVTVTMTPAGVAPNHFIDLHIIAPHATEAQAYNITAVTHHITDLYPIEIFPEMTADFNHTNLTDNITNQHEDLPQVCKQHLGKIRTEGTNRLQLTIPLQNTIAQMIRIVTPRTI